MELHRRTVSPQSRCFIETTISKYYTQSPAFNTTDSRFTEADWGSWTSLAFIILVIIYKPNPLFVIRMICKNLFEVCCLTLGKTLSLSCEDLIIQIKMASNGWWDLQNFLAELKVNLETVYVVLLGCSRAWWHLGKIKAINSWSSANVQVAMAKMSAWSLIVDSR